MRWQRRWLVQGDSPQPWVIPVNTQTSTVLRHRFIYNLAIWRVVFSMLLHVVWRCWVCFTACFYMWFGCSEADLLWVFTWSLAMLILGSACLGFYYPYSKTMQVIILKNNLDKVRSQKQPGTVPCNTIIKYSSSIMPQLPPSWPESCYSDSWFEVICFLFQMQGIRYKSLPQFQRWDPNGFQPCQLLYLCGGLTYSQ